MIKSLHIKNYALLKDVNINFTQGFTVISGDTGSGKSIILDALMLLLGKRVERLSAHKNTSKTIIEGIFHIEKSKFSFFKKHDLDIQKTTIIRREINTDGKSRAFINDTPVLLNVLSKFGDQIIDIHAQNQTILLKNESSQFALIDKLSKSEEILSDYQKELKKYNDLNTELLSMKKSSIISYEELDFLKYQLEELESCKLIIGEKKEIEEQLSILENIEGVSSVISDSEAYINDEQGILFQLSTIKRKLSEFDTFSILHERINSIIIELDDITHEFNSLKDNLKSDPEELHSLNTRLNIINQLLQKHRKNSIKELLIHQKDLQKKINLSISSEEDIKSKQNEIEEQMTVLKDSAEILNNRRNKILNNFKKDIEKKLVELGMQYAQFKVIINRIDSYHQLGNTSIYFLFSANKGSDLMDISKVASGGELSRLMLAIKYIATKSSKLNTLIFDEIDIGVSGEIASLMANMMQEMSKSTQVVAISHLPQIASKANEHLNVVKSIIEDQTISDVKVLNKQERIAEIAKLLSGKEVTSAAFENAKVLLNQ